MPRQISFTRRALVAASAGLFALCANTGHAQASPEKVLNIYNWSECGADSSQSI